jgi:DNA-binding transcriptional ArsR family regulator
MGLRRFLSSLFLLVLVQPSFSQSSLDDYRRSLYRIDAATVGISFFVPGFSLLEVDRPKAALVLGGIRLAGMAGMTAAMARQWTDMDAVWSGDLDAARTDRLTANAVIFASGASLMIGSWMTETLMARTIARRESSAAQHLIATLGPQQNGYVPDAPRWAWYISVLAEGTAPDSPDFVIRNGTAYLRWYLFKPDAAEVAYHTGRALHRNGQDLRAVFLLTRALWMHVGRADAEKTRLAALEALAGTNLEDSTVTALRELLSTPENQDPEAAYFTLLERIAEIADPRLGTELLRLAEEYLAAVPEESRNPRFSRLLHDAALLAGNEQKALAAEFLSSGSERISPVK